MNENLAVYKPSRFPLILAFVAGDIAAQQLQVLPKTWAIIAVGALACVLWHFKWRIYACFLFGLVLTIGFALIRLHDALPPELEGKDLLVDGIVSGLPQKLDEGLRFDFRIESTPEPVQASLPANIRLTWYKPQTSVKAAERWRLRVRLKQPHGFFNPGGLDYEQWLFAQGLRATGYVRESQENRRLVAAESAFAPRIWRQALDDRLTETLAGSDLAGIIKALTMGADDDISSEQWEVFRRTGTAHLVAISGSHISLVAGFVFLLVRKLAAVLGILRWPPPKIAAVAAFLAALFYSALADFAIPTQRALIMIAIVMGGILGQRNVRAAVTLATALLAVTAYDPLAVLAPGFWLSFAAVALILFAVSNRLRSSGWWFSLWKVNWVTTLGLAPLLLLFFQQVSLIAPIANLLAVPAIGLVAIPLCLLGSALLLIHPLAGTLVLSIVEHFLQWTWLALTWLSALPFAQWIHARPPLWTLPFALLGVLLLLAPRGIPARWLGLILLIPGLAIRPDTPALGGLWLTLLDVGQGLSTVLRTRNHTLVFDTGARLGNRFDMGSAVIEPFLHEQGIARIDTLVVSHGDNDHIGGAPALLKRFAIGQTYTSVPDRLPMTSAIPCQAGQSWAWDGVQFEMLSPFGTAGKENDNSCVLKASTAQDSVLLTGDIERSAEQALASRYGEALASTVLIAPHHGSNTSSSQEFLAAVRPHYALVPAGYLNRYGFPHPKVIQRYKEIGATVVNTADVGAISIRLESGDGAPKPESYRLTDGRYWNARPDR